MQPVERKKSNVVGSRPAAESQQLPAEQVSGALTAVILAGSLRHSPLREAMNVHALCLPIGRSGALLDGWLALMKSVAGLHVVRVVVTSEEDAISLRSALPKEHRLPGSLPSVEVMAEPAAWRGAGGVVRDVTEGLPSDAIILVCEGTRLPPSTLDPLLHAAADTQLAGVVGVCGEDTPAGVYAFRRSAIELVPRIGYSDMKEQLLPTLAKTGQSIVVAPLGEDLWPMNDLETYLAAVRHSLATTSLNNANSDTTDTPSLLRVSSRASVSGSAILDGFCIIEPGAVIEDGAVVHDSVILWGATVGGGAVVSRSVVAPLASIEPRERAVRSIINRAASK
jgi:hypothetical protein